MEKTNKPKKQIQKCLFLSLVFIVMSAAAVYAQNESAGKISENGIYHMVAQQKEAKGLNEASETILPGGGSDFNKIAEKVFNFLVDDEPSNLNVVLDNSKGLHTLAVTSSFINNQLLGGMTLEFHANPMKGHGALLFRKTF